MNQHLQSYSNDGPSAMENIFQQNKYGGTACGQYDAKDYANPSPFEKLIAQKTLAPTPSMSNKLNKVAELFELDVLSEDEALKACKAIIGQHAKVQGKTGNTEDAKVIK